MATESNRHWRRSLSCFWAGLFFLIGLAPLRAQQISLPFFPTFIYAGESDFSLTVNGSGFASGAIVNWNGLPLSTSPGSASQLTAQVTANLFTTAGQANITVTNPGGATSPAVQFEIAPRPVVTNISPSTITNGVPFSVTVTGTGFRSGARVYYFSPHDGDLGSAQILSSTTIKVDSTYSDSVGRWSVFVIEPDPTGNPNLFSITSNSLLLSLIDSALTITGPGSLSAGTEGVAYTAVQFTSSGGTGGNVWSATGLPGGMNISPGGSLSGTPAAGSHGSYNPQFKVTDSSSTFVTVSLPLTINPPTLTITGPGSLSAGTEGVAYTAVQFTSSGGTGGNVWSATGLPGGMNISPGGSLSGTPAAGSHGSYNPQFKVTDSSSTFVPVSLPLTINPPTLTITGPGSLSAGTEGVAYTAVQFTSSGGTGGNVWSATGLPGGMNISPGGLLSGTPAAGSHGSYNPQFKVTDSSSTFVTVSLPLTINPPTLTITGPGSLSAGTEGVAYTAVQFTSSGGTGGNVWSATGLPGGMNISPGGSLSGTPAAGSHGSYNPQFKVTDSSSTFVTVSLPLTINPPTLTITGPGSLSAGTEGVAYTAVQFTSSGGTGGNVWSATGLPGGMNISPGGSLSGTPAAGSHGSYNPQFKVTDSSSTFVPVSLPLTINPPTLTITGPGSLSAGTEGVAYTAVQFTSSGGTGGNVWSATGLPGGMNISPGGLLSGTPAAGSHGSYNPQFKVTDSSSTFVTVSLPLTINLVPVFTTIQTTPPGLQFSVDGAALQTAPQSLSLSQGSHTIAVATTQPGAGGTQFVFTNWSDAGAASHTINVGANAASYTANFKTEYRLTLLASPVAGGTVTPASGLFYESGTLVPITAMANSLFSFTSWSGNVVSPSSTSTTVAMSAPQSVTANFVPGATSVTIQSSPPGLQFSVDGAALQTAPQSLSLSQGSHTIAVATTQPGLSGTQFVFTNWSDAGSASHTINVAVNAATYTANFKTQYQLTSTIWPTGFGSVTASPTSPDGYYDNGTTVKLTAAPAGQFANWSGDLSGSANPQSFILNSPRAVTANFSNLSITFPTSLPTGAGGVPYGPVMFTANGGTGIYTWSATGLPPGLVMSAAGALNGTPMIGSDGAYTAKVTVRDSGGSSSPPTSLLLPISTPALTITCSSINGPTVVSIVYTVTCLASGGAAPYSWSISSGLLPAGLTLSSPTGNGFTVSGAPTSAGPYDYRVKLTDSTASAPQIATQHYSGNIGIGPALTVSPAGLTFTYQTGDPTPAGQSIAVFDSIGTTTFTAITSGGSWLSVSPGSGPTPGNVMVTVDPIGLTAASTPYSAQVIIAAQNTTPAQIVIPVNLTIANSPPQLGVSPSQMQFTEVMSNGQDRRQLVVSNAGGGTLAATAQAQTSNCGNWLTLLNGSTNATSAAPGSIGFAADPSGLSGTCLGKITVSGAGQTAIVPVTMVITNQQPSLQLSQAGVSFQATSQGPMPGPQTLGIVNTGSGAMGWSVQPDPSSPWLSVTPGDGQAQGGSTASTVTVSANPQGLAPGQYSGTLRVTAPDAGNSPKSVVVSLSVLDPGLSVPPQATPSGIILVGPIGGTLSSTENVHLVNASNAPLDYTSTVDQAWLKQTPPSGTVPSNGTAQISVQANLSGLDPRQGVFRTKLRIAFADGTVQTVDILLLFVGGENSCDPNRDLRAVFQNSAAAQAQSPLTLKVQVKDCSSGTLVTPLNKGRVNVLVFLADSPLVETLPLTTVDENGVWTGSWTPARSGVVALEAQAFQSGRGTFGLSDLYYLTPILTVNVKAADTNAPAAITSVRNGASNDQDGQIAPATWVSIAGVGLADAFGEAASTPYPQSIQGTDVRIQDQPLSLLFVNENQISAVIPSTITAGNQQLVITRNGKRTPFDVQVRDIQPGLFSMDRSGQGQGAILIGATAVIAGPESTPGATPVSRGNYISIYGVGFGPVGGTAPPDGAIAPLSPLITTKAVPKVTIGGMDSPDVSFSGLAPTLVSVYVVNAKVPDSVPPGDNVPVTVTIGGITTNTVTIAVR